MQNEATLRLAVFVGLFVVLAVIERFAPRRTRPELCQTLAYKLAVCHCRYSYPKSISALFTLRSCTGRRRCLDTWLGPVEYD